MHSHYSYLLKRLILFHKALVFSTDAYTQLYDTKLPDFDSYMRTIERIMTGDTFENCYRKKVKMAHQILLRIA